MASNEVQDDDDGMDEFMDKFKTQNYKNAFSEDNWEEEFDRIPMFMKKAPEEIDPQKYPELACLQAILHDEDRPPEEQAKSLKDEGNAYFKEKNYEKAILSYTAGLKKKCGDQELDTVLLTNRAAAHFHLGNMRSAFNDAAAAKKIKPDHLKALIRGAQSCIELRNFADAVQWCDEGLKAHPTDKKLQELRAAADKHKVQQYITSNQLWGKASKDICITFCLFSAENHTNPLEKNVVPQRAKERDSRKAKIRQKKLLAEKEALLTAIKNRGIKLLQSVKPRPSGSNSEDEDEGSSAAISQLSLDGLGSQEATGAQVFLDEQGSLHWPVLFLYPEHQQTDFISAFSEKDCFLDHVAIMFGEELPPWDVDRKYHPKDLQLYFEDEEKDTLYQVNQETSLLKVLTHKRFFVKSGSPSFIVLVKNSSFSKQFFTGKTIRSL